MSSWIKNIYEHDRLAISKSESVTYSTLYKFGFNPDIGTDEETIWGTGGNLNWSNDGRVYAVSSSTDDTFGGDGANTITVEGLDDDYNFKSSTVNLSGQVQALVGTYGRVNRAYISLAGANGTTSGTITLQSSDAIKTYTTFDGNSNQTQMAVYTVPAGHTLYLDDINFTSALSQANKFATVSFVTRDFGSNVFRTRFTDVIQSSHLVTNLSYPLRLDEKTDMECRAFTNTTGNSIAASFQGVLIKNDPTGTI